MPFKTLGPQSARLMTTLYEENRPAPHQRAGILAVDVLAAKDVEKAIADRATWWDDGRRWCREGKLPKPGWWE